MSLTFNMVGGGGGGELLPTDAILRVQAPAGSTVTITKGTTTKTDLGHENADDHTLYDYYFIIHQSQFDSVNPWTVTGVSSDQTQTDSATIIINSADEYDVELTYGFYLFKNGNSYLDVTGGWTGISNITAGVVENNQLHVYGGSHLTLGTVNLIDLTGYTKLRVKGTAISSGTYCMRYTGAYTSRTASQTPPAYFDTSGTGAIDQTLDISALTSAYIVMRADGSGNATIDEVYLE